ncbi:MAG: 50S ribosomal protein L21 [Acidobacteria bacterium]|nr:MAG: 50S ribosomal protein L21 [Acidobacteriota bacterium]
MYAIIETGGKQQKVIPGEQLRIEKLEAKVGDTVRFDKVMLVNRDGVVALGKPYVDGASVTAKVMEQGRGKKILVFKKKRRKQYQRMRGHRQSFTAVKVEAIEG